MKLKHIIILAVMMLNSIMIYAQNQKRAINYSKKPYWIEMMNDPKANYFETVKAYDQFWEKRKQPKEEDEIIGQSKTAESKRSFLSRWFKSKEERDEEEIKKYALDVKKYKHWKLKTEPYVQEDGTILDADARLKLWQDQQQKN
ncbi:MAG: hypothetical protein V4677_10740 [Bacteroidota bacterium]